MAKRAHNRPQKSKNRPKRPASRADFATSSEAPAVSPEGGLSVASTGGATPVVRPAVTRASASAGRRGPTSARRVPTIAINYAYLRRDIRSLAVLAPTMIVLLVIAFFVLH